MTDQPRGDARPQPLYGQYATPEEQRARIAQPDATYALETGQAPEPAEPARPASSTAAPVAPATVAARRRVDMIVTLVLLGYGLVNVVVTAVQLSDFPAFAQEFMRVAGIDGSFTNDAQGQLWSTIGAIAYAAVYLAVVLVVVLLFRRGRRTWWVPLTGAVLAFVLLTVCLTSALIGDPAIMGYFLRSS
nr:DUF6264 family protein [Microbacterium lemovicicum]